MGRMLAHFLTAVAEFEQELIRERVQSGLANTKARGKSLGRPRAAPSRVQKTLMLLDQGQTYQEAIKQTGLSVSTLIRADERRKMFSRKS
jgi:DNA invertase Pin-like site-specific DNA recombinase